MEFSLAGRLEVRETAILALLWNTPTVTDGPPSNSHCPVTTSATPSIHSLEGHVFLKVSQSSNPAKVLLSWTRAIRYLDLLFFPKRVSGCKSSRLYCVIKVDFLPWTWGLNIYFLNHCRAPNYHDIMYRAIKCTFRTILQVFIWISRKHENIRRVLKPTDELSGCSSDKWSISPFNYSFFKNGWTKKQDTRCSLFSFTIVRVFLNLSRAQFCTEHADTDWSQSSHLTLRKCWMICLSWEIILQSRKLLS